MAIASNEQRDRDLSLRSPIAWVVFAAALAFAGLGLRGLLDPVGAGVSLGIGGLSDGGARAMQATGARNLALAITALVLTLLDARRALAVLILSAGGIAGLDFVVVMGIASTAILAKHVVYVVLLSTLGAALWRLPSMRR